MRARSLLPGAALALGLAGAMQATAREALAQPLDSLRARVEGAVARGDGAALDLVVARLRREARATPGHLGIQYELGYALHRRADAMLRSGRRDEARRLLEEADHALSQAVSLGGGGGALALRGTVNGRLAAVSGMVTSMRLEPRAFRQLDSALALAPEDPRVALLNGIARLDAPRSFGGGIEQGEKEIRRALRLFETDSARAPAPTWGRADAHIWLGIVLAKRGLREEARASFERALEIVPDHHWVTSTLLPQVSEAKVGGREPRGGR